ncbi:MAG TPA: hypothetical protein VFS43_03270 [Polyangiaceae bacterium]|nr:hypothetical protein [Polyangiaceae bacterium]
MNTTIAPFFSPVLLTSSLALLAAGGALGACSGEFKTRCPDGTVQIGGGDVNDPGVCKDAAGGAGGEGGAPGMGSGGGGGIVPVPPGGDCNPNATKCEGDAQQTCGPGGTWGEAVGCEIACDGAGKACVVPVQLAAGQVHTCARMSDGTVRCWGSNGSGQLGSGGGDSVLPVVVPDLASVASMTAGMYSSCATLADETARCWGVDPSKLKISGKPQPFDAGPMAGVAGVRQVGVGGDHVCVLQADAKVLCKGTNDVGQLGDGSAGAPSFFSFVGADFSYLPAPTSIALGGYTSCAVLEGGGLACWGGGLNGANGGLGGSDFVRPTSIAGDVVAVANGKNFACAARKDKVVLCWGVNQWGQLGHGSPSPGGEPPRVIDDFGGVENVAVGDGHACALKSDRSLWCWGRNDHGQLGFPCDAAKCENIADNPESPSALRPVRVALDGVVGVSLGTVHTCAQTEDSKAYCWGVNNLGQLGIGTTGEDVTSPTPVVWKLRAVGGSAALGRWPCAGAVGPEARAFDAIANDLERYVERTKAPTTLGDEASARRGHCSGGWRTRVGRFVEGTEQLGRRRRVFRMPTGRCLAVSVVSGATGRYTVPCGGEV